MTRAASLRCRCGDVVGEVTGASPKTVNRVVCYCTDCQAYLHHLERTDLLDAHGGTDLIQIAPATLRFVRGGEHIVGLRLSEKGLYRWFASCCKTPLGNTVGPSIPFVGTFARTYNGSRAEMDVVFGPAAGALQGKNAVGKLPQDTRELGLGFLARTIAMVLGWRFRGQAWPHPFFARASSTPTRPVTVLSRDARDALRPLCGPKP